MSFQPVDKSLDAILKVADRDERAANELIRYTLYEALTDQIEVARPRLEQDGVQLLAKRSAQARASLLRSTVGKALDGADDEADLDTASNLAIIDAYVQKSLFGTVLSAFNRQHPHSAVNGRFVSTQDGGNEQDTRSQESIDARAMFTRGINALADEHNNAKKFPGSAEDWNRPGNPGDRKSFRRLSMTGAALQSASAEGSLGHNIGVYAQLAGNIGPEAEKVLGPGLRRTAYRYRGTEKRPDKTLVDDVASAQGFADGLAGDDQMREETMNSVLSSFGADKKEATPAVGATANYLRPAYRKFTRDQYELAIRGDTAAIDLMDAIPDRELTKISIEAGELPPSQGVIIDADGDVTSQAQGFNGDHYLPFDLKNLADLHGGQYVRTRAAGGPTTEDIYTGLLSGARQIQVISNSGVYSVEFDPDIRGGRRYSDKAARMIGRYSKLLEAIDGGNLYEEDIDAATVRDLRKKAYEQTGWNAEEGNKRYLELRAEARLKGSYNQDSEDDRFKAAVQQVRDENKKNRDNPNFQGLSNSQFNRDVEDILREGNADAATKRVRQMVLDGKGYAKALLTLKQEFPFYIRSVRYDTIPEFVESRKAPVPPTLDPNAFSRDTGHVKPGQTNAHASLSRDAKTGDIRDGRLVPTLRSKQAEVSESGDAATANTTRNTLTSSSRSADGQGLRPPARDETGVIVTTEANTASLVGLLIKEPHWENVQLPYAIKQTAGAFQSLAGVEKNGNLLYRVESDPMANEDLVLHDNGSIGFAQFEWSKRGTGFTRWLLHEARPDQRKAVVDGFKQASVELDGLQNDEGANIKRQLSGNNFNKYVDQIEAITGLADTFAPAAENLTLAMPDVDDPRPQPWSSITQLGNRVVQYDKYVAAAKDTNPRLAAKISAYSAAPDTPPDDIRNMLDQLRLLKNDPARDSSAEPELTKEIGAAQAAWAYVVARKIAEVVDETPKEKAPQGPPVAEQEATAQRTLDINPLGAEGSTKQVVKSQRRVVFHKNSEAYEQAMARAFKMR